MREPYDELVDGDRRVPPRDPSATASAEADAECRTSSRAALARSLTLEISQGMADSVAAPDADLGRQERSGA